MQRRIFGKKPGVDIGPVFGGGGGGAGDGGGEDHGRAGGWGEVGHC